MKKKYAGNLEEPVSIDNNELPEGWEETPLLELCELIRGVSYTKGEESHTPGKGFVPLLRANNIARELTFDDIYFVPERYVKPKQFLQVGDALFAMSSGSKSVVGKAATVTKPFDGAFGAFCGVLRPSNKVDWKFFGYFFQTKNYRDRISEASAGVNINNLKREYFEAINFPLPPLSEQEYIVARVEAILIQVNAARDRLSRVPLIMKRFRQGVLAAACSGRLTEGWREENPDVESGTQLLERLTDSRKKVKKIGKTFEENTFFEQFPELPITWTWSTIQQLAERVTVGHVGPMKNEYRSEGIPFLRCQNVRENYFDPQGLVYVSPQFHESLKKSALEPGDLVVVRSGNVGVCCIIPEFLTEANCSDLVVVKQPFGFVPKFGAYYVNSLAQKWIDLGTVGIALSHFNTKSVATLPIPLPPLAEQHEIVRRVGLMFERADAIDREVMAAGRRCERLTQAVLGKAYAGKL